MLEATGIVEIDYTAAQVLVSLIRECHAQEIVFSIARLESVRAQEALTRFHIHEVLQPDRIFRSVEEAIRALGPRAKPGSRSGSNPESKSETKSENKPAKPRAGS